jgi:23S rRNA (guanine745-N1)-methyltransferase
MTATGFTSPAQRRETLSRAADLLRCPVCAGRLSLGERALACSRGHSFDIARQGYVNLTAGRAGPGTGDSAAMVTAREEFLGAGHYRPIAASAQSLAARLVPAHGDDGLAVDLAGGTGYYLAQVLDALPGRAGLCVDLSAPALRRAARAHPRAAAIGADAWQPLPLAERAAVLVLSIFGPRNAAEIGRILTPGGTLIIAAPGPAHLAELRGPIGIIGIDDDKDRRIADAFGGYDQAGEADVRFQLRLNHAGLAALVGMGPSARHIAPETLTARIRAMPTPVMATADVRVRAFRRPRLHFRPPSKALAPRSHGNRRLAAPGRAESGPDGDRALRHQLDHRPEGFPPVGHRGIAAPPRAAVAARLVQGAGQRADRAEQLRPCRLVQPRQHRVDLREQPGDHPEAARQLRSGLRAADLTNPAHRPVRGAGEVHRNADQGIVGVHAAGAEVQRLPHAPAAGVQPLRPRHPVAVLLVSTEKAVLVVEELVIGVTELAIKVRLIEHDALELAGIQPECLLEPGDITLAQQVEQRLLVCLRTCLRTPSGHRNPPLRWIELTFKQYGGGTTKRG